MTEDERFVDPGATRWDLIEEILVACPRCDGPAVVSAVEGATPENAPFADRRLACGSCGSCEAWPGSSGERALRWWTDGRDPYFGARLLLTTPCAGHVLWAYNQQHLDLLEGFVAASHRQRSKVRPGGGSLVQDLPPWLKSAKNRTAVLAACRRLRSVLAR